MPFRKEGAEVALEKIESKLNVILKSKDTSLSIESIQSIAHIKTILGWLENEIKKI